MKILILSLFISFQIFAQDSKLLLLFDSGIIYNGSELIPNAINRDMEVGSEIITNGSFGSNITGWTAAGGTGYWYNTDWNGVGRTNALLDSATTNSSYVNAGYNFTSGVRYKVSWSYYIPSTNTTTVRITPRFIGGTNPYLTHGATLDSWATLSESHIANASYTTLRFYQSIAVNPTTGSTAGDKIYLDNVSVKPVPYYASNGNHTFDSSSTYKQAGTYSGKIVATAAGNGTTNTISLASTLFTAVTSGTNYRFQVYAYTSTANTTLTFKLGDIVLTNIVPTTGMSVLNFDFKATASTTGNILLYLDKAATVYIDEVSLKSGS